MQLDDFNFELPPHFIARFPLPKRSASRLLCLSRKNSCLIHRQFSYLFHLLEEGDLLVFNDTKVIPARMFGHKKTGGRVEVLMERVIDDERFLAQLRVSKAPHIGDELFFREDISFEIVNRYSHFYELCYRKKDRTVLQVMEAIGEIPLPPYLHRNPQEEDKVRYQTIYAKQKGSVAAPTAGLHFDEEVLQALRNKNIQMGYLTLHIGAGTFAPIRVEEIKQHQMHAEYLEISESLCEQIEATKLRGKRVIAVGTTSLRALEAASQTGKVMPYQGDTRIFIYPGFTFHCVDALITNFHLPRSTLLMLTCAFGGYDLIMRAYREALAASYRFYSYGDAMWIGN